ncbi:hypothetical protein [Nocardia sp. NPDC004711]
MSADENDRKERERRQREHLAAEAARRDRREAERRTERARKSNEKGRNFHEGMAQLRGETPENGWEHEKTTETSLGGRRHDTSLSDERGRVREATEYKNRERIRADELMQLAKIRECLDRDREFKQNYVIREHTRIDPIVERQLERMREVYGPRFNLERVSRERARQADRIGRDYNKGHLKGDQLELHNVEQLRKQQREKERADRVREKLKTQEAVAASLARREAERERERVRDARQHEFKDRERELRKMMPGAPDDIIQTLARSGETPSEVAARQAREARAAQERGRTEREAHERTHQQVRDRDAQARNRDDRGRDGRGRG